MVKQSELLTGLDIRVVGHLKIFEYDDRQQFEAGIPARTLLNRRNAIHKDNVAILAAKTITSRTPGHVAYMGFGNGGTTVDPTGTVVFNSPRDTGLNRDLYNPVYFSLVDDTAGSLPGNQMGVRHIANTLFTDSEIRCLIGQNEPFGQLPANTLPTITVPTAILNINTQQFAFDEIGLKLADGTLVTHVIFVPVVKTASSLLEIIYTIRVAITDVDFIPPPLPLSQIRNLSGVNATADVGTLTVSRTLSIPLNGVGVTAQTGTVELDRGFEAGAVFLDGNNYLWNFPSMNDSPVGSLSYWMYTDNFPGFTNPVIDTGDLHNFHSAQILQGSTGPDNVLVLSTNECQTRFDTSSPSLEITNITSANPAVVTFANPHGIQAGSWVFSFFFSQTGWDTGFDNRRMKVSSVTSTTMTLVIDTTLLPGYISGGTNQAGLFQVINATDLLLADINEANDAVFTVTNSLPPRTWINVLLSWDANHPAGSKIYTKYYNDTPITPVQRLDGSPAFSIGYSQPDYIAGTVFDAVWSIGGGGSYRAFSSTGIICYLAEFWFAPGQFIDFTNSANRAKFHDLITGKPKTLGPDGSLPTGTPPTLYQTIPRSPPDPYTRLGLPLRFINMQGNEIDTASGTLANGITTSTSLTVSFWAWGGLDAEFSGSPTEFVDIYAGRTTVSVTLWDASKTNKFAFNFPYPQAGLKNIRFAVDTNHAIGAKIVYAYVNNTAAPVTITADTVNNLLVNWVESGGGKYSFYTYGFVSTIWIAPDQFFDPVNDFIDLSGNPVSLGSNGQLVTGTAPSFYWNIAGSQPADDFAANLGTGGASSGTDFVLVPTAAGILKNNTGGNNLHMAAAFATFPMAPTSPTD